MERDLVALPDNSHSLETNKMSFVADDRENRRWIS
jgi:hypothetical protein